MNHAIPKQAILEIIGKYLDISCYAVFMFGSRVSGKGDERSDIDIGIEGPEPIPIETLGAIRDEMENIPTMLKIDVVDFAQTSPQFREVAKQNVEYFT